jgi:hypothetical protein
VTDGLLGSYSFDAVGDPAPPRVTVVRLERPGRSNAIQSYDGARIVSVIAPPRRLFNRAAP